MDERVRFVGRVVASHTGTYVVAGLLASQILDYASLWAEPHMAHMRPLDSPWVAAGPGLQLIRGLILAAALAPFRSVFLEQPGGWWRLWGLLVGVGILSTYAAAPGSVEGLIYLKPTPWAAHRGILEVLAQSLAFSVCLVGWSRRPGWPWTVTLGGLTAFALFASTAGVLVGSSGP